MTEKTNETNENKGRITLDSVRECLTVNSLVADSTNASEVRKLLGRGSFATIQKHLETIRNEGSEEEKKEIYILNKESASSIIKKIEESVSLQMIEQLNDTRKSLIFLSEMNDALCIERDQLCIDLDALSESYAVAEKENEALKNKNEKLEIELCEAQKIASLVKDAIEEASERSAASLKKI